jgi:4,5-dihydroxyphthalate decarboxylase
MISLTCAISDYEHVRDLESGRVRTEGFDLNLVSMPVEEIFYRMIRHREFDLSEMSMGRFAALASRQDCPFVAIPVFPSRMFRHSAIYVRGDCQIRDPKQLKGRRIGIPEWAQTAGIYVRGILSDQFGVAISDIEWFQGGLEQPGRDEEVHFRLPEGVKLTPVKDRTINDMLSAGDLDALISAHPPLSFKQKNPTARLLFENVGDIERRYWRETGIFPIMHVVVLRRDVYAAHPWVVMNLFKAFTEAKDRSLARAKEKTASRLPIPGLADVIGRICSDFGEDFWPYGIGPNRKTLDAFLGYANQQGVTARRLQVDELFPPEAGSEFKI